MLVHGLNLHQKETHRLKYRDVESRQYLREIREKYDDWHQANLVLSGPFSVADNTDQNIVKQRVSLLESYKNFIDQQKYAEKFDSRSNLYSTVLEEFLFYLFRDVVSDLRRIRLIVMSSGTCITLFESISLLIGKVP